MSFDLPPVVDALVVGGGPAGLSAATWLGRYWRTTVVVDAGHQRNLPAERAHGLLGRDPITPQQLLVDSRAGLKQYPHVALRHGTVSALYQDGDGLFRAIVDGAEIRAARVVLATGVKDQLPQIVGFSDHYGVDVHHCPACEGYTARGQVVIVLGSGAQLPEFAAELLDWAETVRIIDDPTVEGITDDQRTALASHGIEVVDGVAESLNGAPGALAGVRLADGQLVEGDTVFFSYGHQPVHDLAQQLGCELDHEGRIVVNDFQLTSVDGVYAAGDITAGLQLIPVAIGSGTVAGIACATSVRGHPTDSPTPHPAPPAHRFAGE